MFFGLIGAVGGAFAGGFISAARCDGGLERLGVTFVGVGLGAIVAKSIALALAAHLVNHRQGNLPPTFLPTLLLAVPIPCCVAAGIHCAVGQPIILPSGVGLREGTTRWKKGGPPDKFGLR